MRTLDLLLDLGVLSGATSGGSTTGSGSSAGTAGWDGGELGGTLGDQLYRVTVSEYPIPTLAGCYRTSSMLLPSSSEMSFSRRSSSASMPTDSRTALTSLAEGEVLPPSPRRRNAAKCFILIAVDVGG